MQSDGEEYVISTGESVDAEKEEEERWRTICCLGRLSVCLLFSSLEYDLSSEQLRICRRRRRRIVVHLLPGAVVCLHRPTCVSVIQTAYVHSLIHPLLMLVLMRIR